MGKIREVSFFTNGWKMESQVSILYGKHFDFDLTYLSHFSFVSTAQVEIFSFSGIFSLSGN